MKENVQENKSLMVGGYSGSSPGRCGKLDIFFAKSPGGTYNKPIIIKALNGRRLKCQKALKVKPLIRKLRIK